MRAGALRHRGIVERPTLSQDETGEQVPGWELVKISWMSIQPLNGRERLQASQIGAELDTRIRVRWSPELDTMNATWRVRHHGVIYNISAPPAQIDLRRREIEVMCASGLNEG